MGELISLCKRRGFVFQSSEIYGGVGSVWDYGPVGVEMKRNVKDAWWRAVVREREDVVGLDSAILMHPEVWEASGHLQNFTDPLAECSDCRQRFRSNQLDERVCPNCGGRLGEPKAFNLMFKTHMGPVTSSASEIYLRPETAQGIFVNFDNVRTTTRKQLPFGIAQLGKSFRNEITPGNFTFRTREFEQMEMEFFCSEGEDGEWYEYWIDFSLNWFRGLGIRDENLRLRRHEKDELPHYAKSSADLEYCFPWGWGELETIANRTDYDLRAHSKRTGRDLSYFDEVSKKRFLPFVIEPAMGADRSMLAFLADAYDEDAPGGEKRAVLRLHPDIAPFQVAVLPLSRNERLSPHVKRVHDMVRVAFACQYDDSQSIGRRYRRQDEIGTVLCVTVDFDTIEDNAVTIRDRDTMKQVRVPIENLLSAIGSELDRMRKEQ